MALTQEEENRLPALVLGYLQGEDALTKLTSLLNNLSDNKKTALYDIVVNDMLTVAQTAKTDAQTREDDINNNIKRAGT